MSTTLTETTLAELLPGTWKVAATNLPLWLGAGRVDPTLTYELASENPLVLSADVAYLTEEGEEKHLLGRDTWRHDGFVRRGKGWSRIAGSRWSISGGNDDNTILTVRFSKSRAIPEGLDVLVREGVDHPELRATIARNTEQFGLSPEDFASLSWLAPSLGP